MFWHNLKYTIKTLLKNKTLIFWTFAFPIILGFLFNMAFSDIENDEKLKEFDIAVVNNDKFKNNEIYKEALKELSKDNEDKLFNITYTTKEKANKLLDKDKIEGYLYFESDTPKIVIRKSKINQTVLKFVVEEIEMQKNTLTDLVKQDITNKIKQGNYNIDKDVIIKNISNKLKKEHVVFKNASNSNMSYMMIEFYTLIAMTCMYGATIGLTAINQSLPDMGNIGKRTSITPTKKSIIVLSKAIASYIISLAGILILIAFLKFVLKIDFGNNTFNVILLALTGTLAGTSLGVLMASTIKAKEGTKIGIVIAVTMFLSVLSGMMGVTLKYIIDRYLSIINIINPTNMITDGFYTLYYYNSLERFWLDIISLIIFSLICLIISSISIRREKYDSI